MHIVHVVESLDPANGGPSVSVPSLAAAQASLGNRVAIVFYSGLDSEISMVDRHIPEFANVTLHAVNAGGIWEKLTAFSASDTLLKVVPDADIVHIHGIWGMMLLRAACVAKKLRIRYTVAPRGMLAPWSLRQKRIKKFLMWWVIWKRILDDSIFLHMLNKAEAELIVPLGLRCPIKIFPNGTFVESSINGQQETDNLIRRVPELRTHPFVLFLSRLHYVKGLDFLLEAFAIVSKENPDARLLIAGPDSGFGDEARRMIERYGIQSSVYMVGPLYGQAKSSALALAKCFCLPSRQEGFSMAILEALSAGLPVVITHSCHFPEVAEVGAGKTVDQSPKQIAEALLTFLEDKEKHSVASKAGRQLVASRYQWRTIAEKTLHAYALDYPSLSRE